MVDRGRPSSKPSNSSVDRLKQQKVCMGQKLWKYEMQTESHQNSK